MTMLTTKHGSALLQSSTQRDDHRYQINQSSITLRGISHREEV